MSLRSCGFFHPRRAVRPTRFKHPHVRTYIHISVCLTLWLARGKKAQFGLADQSCTCQKFGFFLEKINEKAPYQWLRFYTRGREARVAPLTHTWVSLRLGRHIRPGK